MCKNRIKLTTRSLYRGCVLLLLTAVCQSFYGQEMPTIIPPSPEASQLAKFVEMPVSLYTGVPNISMPVYTINAKGVQVPISISYHAKGIQVSEIASRVGLGWTLNAGGVITRQVRERADDEQAGYLRLNYLENFDDYTVRNNLFLAKYTDYYNPLREDMTPDMFQFNFLGFSGKFIFNQTTKTVIVQSKEDITITPIFGSFYKIEGFTVKDKYGNTYIFTVVDALNSVKTDVFYNNDTDPYGMQSVGTTTNGYFSAWYLSKIITQDKEEINFLYEPETVYHHSISDYQENFLGMISRTYHKNKENQQQLKQISYKNTTIIFEKDTALREDLQGSKALKNIYVKYTTDTIKRFALEHHYTTAPDPNNQNDSYLEINEPQANKRLFLKSFQEIAGSEAIKTEFVYSDILLPNRHSLAKDVWGYYNGKHTNFAYFVNPDRKIDPSYTQAGLLQKIIHPTGGVTEFEYEPNKVTVPEFLQEQPFVKDVFMTDLSIFDMVRHVNYYNPTTTTYQKSLHIGGTSNVSFNSFISYGSECPEDSQQPMYEVKITGGNPSVIYYLELGRTQTDFALPPGDYLVTVTPKCDVHHPPPHTDNPYLEEDFFVVLKWIEIDNTVPIYGPGNRIQFIQKKDNNDVQLRKGYEYTYTDQTCSGKLFAIPDYLYAVEFIDNVYEVYSTKTGSTSPISCFNNGDLGYEHVIEKTYAKETQKNYKSYHTFSVYSDMGEFYKPLIFFNLVQKSHSWFLHRQIEMHQPTDLGFMRGLPLMTEHHAYDESTTSYKRVKRIVNEYNNLPICDTDLNCFLISPYEGMFYNENNFEFVHIPRFGQYVTLSMLQVSGSNASQLETQYFVSNFISLKKTTEKNYLDSNEEITVIRDYSYDSPHHLQLTNEVVQASDSGGIIDTHYDYAEDTNNQLLIDSHMIGIPLVTETKRNGETISTQETVYTNWGTTNDPLLFPQKIKASKGDASLDDRIKFNAYDTNGNLLEVQQEGGTVISYIWGYNKTLPIAKIENATNAQIQTALGISTITALTEADLPTINGLRSSLPNAMVTTFTHKPLIGVATVTDPKGYIMTYDYDEFNRLKKVTDAEGNIVTENLYHYRTQN